MLCCAVVLLSCARQAAERILAAEEAEASRLAAAGAEGGETQQSGAGEISRSRDCYCSANSTDKSGKHTPVQSIAVPLKQLCVCVFAAIHSLITRSI